MPRAGHVTAAVLALAGVAAVPAPRQLRSPPLGYTGGFGEPSCVQCHIGNEPNAFGGTVRLEGVPRRYEAGSEYVLTVRLTAEETEVAGFQLAARFTDRGEDGTSAGRLDPVDDRVVVRDSLGVRYAHHGDGGVRPPDRSGTAWAVRWTAPREGGSVALHVAANSGNGDDSPLGDLVFTHVARTEALR